MIFKKFVVGPLFTNSYVFGDEQTKEVVLIDPGADAKPIQGYLRSNGLKLIAVINTHGHGDHIGANGAFKTDVLIHEDDKDLLVNPALNLSTSFGAGITSPAAARTLKDNDKIKVGKISLKVIHTPGHTRGGICLQNKDMLFAGDTLFFEGVGRTDLPGASWSDLLTSIKDKLFILPDECRVFPGHGPDTTIG
ncbi:MAG: MBL fold metallo-hydrolase, partial [Candidatus Omnitrophota bacterium]